MLTSNRVAATKVDPSGTRSNRVPMQAYVSDRVQSGPAGVATAAERAASPERLGIAPGVPAGGEQFIGASRTP